MENTEKQEEEEEQAAGRTAHPVLHSDNILHVNRELQKTLCLNPTQWV